MGVRSDINLIDQARKRGWLTTPRLRKKALARLERILDNPESSDRAVIAAVRALGGLDKVSLDAIRTAMLVKRVNAVDSHYAGAREVGKTLAEFLAEAKAMRGVDEYGSLNGVNGLNGDRRFFDEGVGQFGDDE